VREKELQQLEEAFKKSPLVALTPQERLLCKTGKTEIAKHYFYHLRDKCKYTLG